MSTFTIDKNAPIYVEITPKPGLKQVSKSDPMEDLSEKSAKAVESTMNTIHNMAQRINSTMEALEKRPNQVEIEFFLKFNGEVGVIIAKAGMEAGINVKMSWENKNG